MRLLEHLQQTIGFTRKEALAVLVLSATFLGGVGIRWFQSNQPKPPQKQFDYTQSDSTYFSRAHKPTPAPSASSPQPTASIPKLSRKNNQTVNINTASKTQLMELPGIGPSYAERIIEYRKTRGFASIDELSNVKGIGKKKLEKLRPFILVK